MRIIIIIFIFSITFLIAQSRDYTPDQDWSNLNRYKLDNAQLGSPLEHEKRVVFMGNSITEGWSVLFPEFFEGKPYVNRGISGQTTPQMLVRFRADVIALEPKVVLILAGINDIAGNTGPADVTMITNNIMSMAELAQSNDIHVIICSILPAKNFPWNPGMNPPPKILAVNTIIEKFANDNGIIYLDYYSSMVDEDNALKKEYGYDGVHPNKKGYQVMSLLAENAINRILNN